MEEITDSRGEELIDKDLIHLEESEVSKKTESDESEEPQDYLELVTTK